MNEASLEQLEESLRGNEGLSGVDDFNALAKDYLTHGETIKSLQGELEGKVAIPGENSTDEDRSAFWNKLGRPESPDKYDFEKVVLPEGREADKVLDETIRNEAFKHGVSSKALNALQSAVVKHGVAQQNEITRLVNEQNEKDMNTLKDIWKGDSFKENTEKADRTFKAIVEKLNVPEALGGKDGMIEEFKVMGFLDDSNPKFKYFMAEMFKLIGDDTIITGFPASSSEGDVKRTEGGIPVFKSYAGMNTDK